MLSWNLVRNGLWSGSEAHRAGLRRLRWDGSRRELASGRSPKLELEVYLEKLGVQRCGVWSRDHQC